MVEKVERRWLWGFATAVIVLTTIPYIIGYSRQGSDWRFTGQVIGVEDGNSYLAKMLLGSRGDWLFRTPYTPYPQQGALIYLPFILLGKLSAAPGQHEQLVALFHGFRIAGVFLYVFATYDFIALFIHQPRWRKLGTALATLGGGLGWLAILGLNGLWGKLAPLDFYSPETFGFLMVFALPHLACARAFLLWGLRDYLLQARSISGILPGDKPGLKDGMKTFLLWLGVGLMQPLTVVVGWAVMGAHVAITGLWQAWKTRFQDPADWGKWRGYFWRAVWTGFLSAPMVIYTLLAFKLDPFLREWQGQNIILSPVITHYLLAYGLVLPMVIAGIVRMLREESWQGLLLVGWVLIFPVLAYAPYSLQRRLPEGVWVAMVILSMKFIETGQPAVQRWMPRWTVFSFFSTFILLTGATMAVWSPRIPLFVPASEVKAYLFLADQARPGDIVLATAETANPLPAWAAVHTVIGHGPESIQGPQLTEKVDCFYSSRCSDQDRIKLLSDLGARYVFWGPNERLLGNWDPRQSPYLKLVFQEGDYQLLEYKGNS